MPYFRLIIVLLNLSCSFQTLVKIRQTSQISEKISLCYKTDVTSENYLYPCKTVINCFIIGLHSCFIRTKLLFLGVPCYQLSICFNTRQFMSQSLRATLVSACKKTSLLLRVHLRLICAWPSSLRRRSSKPAPSDTE